MQNKNIFDEISQVKERVKKEILENQNILKLLGVPNENALSYPDIEDNYSLVDKNIFFKPRIFNKTIEGTESYLLTSYSIVATYKKVGYSDIKLKFALLVHDNLSELSDGKARIDVIAKELVNIFDGSYGSWLGKSEFVTCYDIEVPSNYHGLELTFVITDFRS